MRGDNAGEETHDKAARDSQRDASDVMINDERSRGKHEGDENERKEMFFARE